MSKVLHAVVLAAVLAALAGCSGDPEVREPDPTPSPAGTAGATVPAKPPQLGEDSEEGAAAHVYYWIDLLNYAASTGDAEDLLALSERCKECREFASSARDLGEAERPTRDTWTVDDLAVQERDDSTDVTVGITLLGGEQSEVVFQLTEEAPYAITGLARYDS